MLAPCPRCAAPDQFTEPFCATCGTRLLPGDVPDETPMHERSVAWQAAHPEEQAAWAAKVEAAAQAQAAALALAVADDPAAVQAAPAEASPSPQAAEAAPAAEEAASEEQPAGEWLADPPARRRSPLKATFLGIFAGAGHLYVRERLRAITFLIVAIAAGVGIVLGTEESQLIAAGLGALVVLASMFDARRAAKAYNVARPPRGINFALVAVLAVGAGALSLGVVSKIEEPGPAQLAQQTVTTAGTAGKPVTATIPAGDNGGAVAEQVKPSLQEAIQAKVTDAQVTVKTIECLAQTDTVGTCSAVVTDSLGNSRTFPMEYRVGDAGNVRWKITGTG